MKTEHLVARTFFSVSRTFDHHTHMRVGRFADALRLGCVAPVRI